ncbi:hypothetical protein F5Y16DRAFT_404126 [Xylariaceae sp. FL0255]|nr:hypothetical protein F5Y16DRAFT_404126 [Xylariaceae sp. FL0255]
MPCINVLPQSYNYRSAAGLAKTLAAYDHKSATTVKALMERPTQLLTHPTMKSTTLVFTIFSLALTASASRCRIDRWKPTVPGNCASGHKEGDQTENDSCSNQHPNSCYFRATDTTGDPASKLD